MTPEDQRYLYAYGVADPDPAEPEQRKRPSCSRGANGSLGPSWEHHLAHVDFLTQLLIEESARRSRAWWLAAFAVCAAFWLGVWGWLR